MDTKQLNSLEIKQRFIKLFSIDILVRGSGFLGAAISTALISFILFVIHLNLVHYDRKKGDYSDT